jgi:excisionase family DNA binding protein
MLGVHEHRTERDMSQRLLTAAEVAEDLRVSTMTVYRLIRRGELPAVRVGRNYRVRLADLETYLAEQIVDPSTMDLGELADADEG